MTNFEQVKIPNQQQLKNIVSRVIITSIAGAFISAAGVMISSAPALAGTTTIKACRSNISFKDFSLGHVNLIVEAEDGSVTTFGNFPISNLNIDNPVDHNMRRNKACPERSVYTNFQTRDAAIKYFQSNQENYLKANCAVWATERFAELSGDRIQQRLPDDAANRIEQLNRNR
jgi:hypothetical protein